MNNPQHIEGLSATAVCDKIRGQISSPASDELRGRGDDRRYPVSQTQDIPEGLCQCGCGEPTPRYKRTCARLGMVKGESARFVRGHNMRRLDPEYLAEDRGHATPCWIWQRAISRKGYGITQTPTVRTARAHRVYYEREYGAIPAGLQLDHLCRVRCCVNPDHLELVTPRENTRRGDSTKLDWPTVEYIRASEKTNAELSRDLRVSNSTICLIRKGRRWNR